MSILWLRLESYFLKTDDLMSVYFDNGKVLTIEDRLCAIYEALKMFH